MAEMDKLHSEALASKEQELSARINQAVVSSYRPLHFQVVTYCKKKRSSTIAQSV